MKHGKTMLVLVGLKLLVCHGAVGSAEIDSPFGHLPNSAAGTDGLVVDLNVWVFLVILTEPLRIHGVREGGASTGERQSTLRPDYASESKDGQKDTCDSFHPFSPHERFVSARGSSVSRFRVTALLQSIQSLLIYLTWRGLTLTPL